MGVSFLKKKITMLFFALVSGSAVAFAQACECDCMGRFMDGTRAVIGTIAFIIGAFIFSVVFWLTHNWLCRHKEEKTNP